MPEKIILKFTRDHGPYSAGEIAGFTPAKAARLQAVARPYDAAAEKNMDVAVHTDPSVAQAMIEKAEADFAEREAALQEREADIAKREAGLEDASKGERGGGEPSEVVKKTGGEPPKQRQK